MVCHHLNVGAKAKLTKELFLLIIIKSTLIVMTLALGLQPKQRHGKVWAESATRECEVMNPHTPKWTPILGVGIPMESQFFKDVFQGSKLIGLNSSLYH
jgi:hypothetical protein